MKKQERNRWTEVEIDLLRTLYLEGDKEKIVKAFPERSWHEIKKKANYSGFRLKGRKENSKWTQWSEEEIRVILDLYPKMEKEKILELLPNRSWDLIKRQANSLGLLWGERIRNRKWSQEEIYILKNVYPNERRKKILELLPVYPWSSIRRKAAELRLKREITDIAGEKRVSWTKEEKRRLIDLYSRNATDEELVETLPTHTLNSAHTIAGQLGINRRYTHNQGFFYELTPVSAYWAGFVAADGHIISKRNHQGIVISLSAKDEGHLYQLKEDIEFTGNIITKERHRKGRGVSIESTLGIYGASELVLGLEDTFNVTKGKSTMLLLPELPKELLKCYLIGFLDGDGSILLNKSTGPKAGKFGISFLGLGSIIEPIKDYLDVSYPSSRRTSISDCGILKRYAIMGKRADMILSDFSTLDVPFLARKWDKVHAYFRGV